MNANIIIVRNVFKGDFNSGKHVQYVRKNIITIIIVAHRLSTVKECDVIHLMANGKIVNSGTYEHLMTHSDEFRRMAKNS